VALVHVLSCIGCHARMVKLVDTADLKSKEAQAQDYR